jgi:hypothetical protein
VTLDGAPWSVVASLELRSEHYGSWRLGFTSSKRSRGQGDPYPGVLNGVLGSYTAHGGGGFRPPHRLGSRLLQWSSNEVEGTHRGGGDWWSTMAARVR